MSGPGPMRLEPVFIPKVWAAESMAGDLGRLLKVEPYVGEVWLASDRNRITPVAQGDSDLVGLGLDQVMKLHGPWIKGPAKQEGFPLLLKLLNVGQWLSVQVHPNDFMAKELENEPWGKTEAWLILESEPNSQIIMGVKQNADARAFEKAIKEKKLPDLLAKVEARKNQVFHLPAGKVHATGPGLVIFEIQQPSDVTYRFYDWDRPDKDGKLRPLHQKKALKVMDLDGPGEPEIIEDLPCRAGENRKKLVANDYFSLLQNELEPNAQHEWRDQDGLRVIFGLKGEGCLTFPKGQYPPVKFKTGESWLLPAGLPCCILSAEEKGMVYLESRA